MRRTVWITGVSRGLGRELARGFAALGWQVAGLARDADALASLETELGGDHYVQPGDVLSESSIQEWVAGAAATVGYPDLLINNAATINDPKPLWEVSESEFDALVQTNLCGVARMVRRVVPLMIQEGKGIIANLSSGWGRSTSPDVAPYCATKWAIEGLTQALSQEIPAGLAAVAVNPGVIDTAMLRQTWGAGAGEYPGAVEWARIAVPFFASLQVSDNGESLTVG